ncbi:hypothetical protein Pan258_39300 [Symmachiella dynata]|nr:hypothetical protein Pan258_39300 [Symmachiella dynata]
MFSCDFVAHFMGAVVLFVLVVAQPESATANQKGRGADRRIQMTPDLAQSQADLPRKGYAYCAPVSASNGLALLATQGYPQLMPDGQLQLVKTLGSPDFMKTDDQDGTSANDLLSGLAHYIKTCGYEVESLEYQGWRPINDRFTRIPGHADAPKVVNGLQENCMVLLNVGWYKKQGTEYQRVGGHWVTLVGSRRGKNGYLVIHDPSGRSPEGIHERVTASRIRRGTLTGSKKGLPSRAVGAWELGGELKIKKKSGANTSVLDGAILLRLKPAPKPK